MVAFDDGVVHPTVWLQRKAQRLIARNDPRAESLLLRLVAFHPCGEHALYLWKNLGLIAYRQGRIEAASQRFSEAADRAPDDPAIAHALAHCALRSGQPWNALVHGMRSLVFGRQDPGFATFMRSTSRIFRALGYPHEAFHLLLGALERAPRDPGILGDLGRCYEARQMYSDALDTSDLLVEVLEASRLSLIPSGLGSVFPMKTYDEANQRQTADRISERLRGGLALVQDRDHPAGEDATMVRMRCPVGLHTLVRAFDGRRGAHMLLATAEEIWARSCYRELDVALSRRTLAAAVHWIVERMYWRVPADVREMELMYERSTDRVCAAARVVARNLELAPAYLSDAMEHLDEASWLALRDMHRAFLYGVGLSDVEPAVAMLSDSSA